MLKHPTAKPDPTQPLTALVLVGKPAAGKTTIRQICSDYGVVGCDLADAHNESGVSMETVETLIDTLIEDVDTLGSVCCIEGPITEAELEYIRRRFEATVVVRVEANNDYRRIQRYVERSVDDETPWDTTERSSLELEARTRENIEMPYPRHDVVMRNDESTTITELTERCVNLLAGISNRPRDAFESPADLEARQ